MAQKVKPGLQKLRAGLKTGGTGGAAPAPAPAAAVGNTGGYYAPREYGAQAEHYAARAEAARKAMEEQQKALRESQRALEASRTEMEWKKKRYYDLREQLTGDGADELLAGIEREWTDAVGVYGQAKTAYDQVYQAYSPYESAYNREAQSYNDYIRSEQEAYGAWKSTIRGAGDIRAEQQELGKRRQELRYRMQRANEYSQDPLTMPAHEAAANEERIRELQEYLGGVGEREKLLEEELGWSEHFRFEDLRANADFAQQSQYRSTGAAGQLKVDPMTGRTYDAGSYDRTYEYVNRNAQAVGAQAMNDVNNDMGHLQTMTDDEIAMYNYLYATQGPEGAAEYLGHLRLELTRRQQEGYNALIDETVRSGGVPGAVLASAGSLLLSPFAGLQTAVGQLGSALTGQEIDPNAGYAMVTNTKNALRQSVSQQVEAHAGPVGSFAYQTVMSMGDMLMDAAVGGPGAMALIGTRAFSEGVMDAKGRGLSNGKALTLGAISGLAEVLTERIGLDEMLHLPDGWEDAGFWKGLARGMGGEAAEEGLTNIVNLAADLAYAGKDSEFMRTVRANMEQQILPDGSIKTGMTEEEATKAAVIDALKSFGLDALGGALSGGAFGGYRGWQGKKASAAQKNASEEAKASEAPEGEVLPTVEDPGGQMPPQSQSDSSPIPDGTGEPVETAPVAGSAGDSSADGTVSAQDVRENVQEEPELPVAEPVNENGGNGNGEEAGADVSDGDKGGRTDAGAGEPSYGLDDSPEGRLQRREQQAQTASRRAGLANNAAQLGQVQRVSAHEMGVRGGTQWQELVEIPRSQWDSEMLTVARRCETATGRKVRFVDKLVCVRDSKGGQHRVAGIVDGDQIIMTATHSRWTVEQIADHEEYHAKAQMFAQNGINEQLQKSIVESMGEEQLREVIETYTKRLDWMKDIPEDISEEELERLAAKLEAEVLEEILADAYAGINRYEGHAERFEAVVNDFMDEQFIGKRMRNETAAQTEAAALDGGGAVNTDTGQAKYLEDDSDISQERIDAMVQRSNEVFGRKIENEMQRGVRSHARKIQRSQERAEKHKADRKRHLEEAKETLKREPDKHPPRKENKLTTPTALFAKRNVRKQILDTFHVPKGQRVKAAGVVEQYLDGVQERGYLEDADLRNLMDKLIELGVMEVEPDEIMVEGRNYLKDGHIYVSEELRREFGDDWNRVKNKAFGLGVWITSDRQYAGVDVWNQEMAGLLPGMFSADETDQRTMLERLLWIAEEGKAEKMSLAEYTKMLAKQEHQSEAELLDSMAQELGGILRQFARDAKMEIRMRQYTKKAMDQNWERTRDYTKKAVDRQRLYRLADKAHYREHLERTRSRRELNELQNRTLKTLQWLNRNKRRAPEELQEQINEVLGNIDLFAIGAADELNWHPKYQMSWKELAEVYEAAKAKAAKGEGNFFADPELERIVNRLKKDKLADLDVNALNNLFNAAVAIRKAIFDSDRLLSDENDKRIGELFTEMTGEMKWGKALMKGKGWDKFFNLEHLTPMNVLRQMGGWRPDGAWARMADLLEKGEQDVRAYKVNAARILKDFLNDHADWIHKADGQGKDGIWIECEVPQLKDIGLEGGAQFGDTVKVWMTPMQRVHLYLESRNEDNLRHMVGGRTFVDKELYSKGKRNEAFAQGITVKMAPETVRALVKDMTPEELELARLLDSYYNGMAPGEINRVSMVLYGFNKAMGKGYAPIFTNQNFVNSEAGIFDQTAESVGNLKERVHAGNPSYNISALDAFERNVDKTAQFVGMAIPARDWNALMNWRTRDSSMRQQIDNQWGHERQEYIDELLVDLQGGHPARKKNMIERAADALLDRYISSVFGFNPSIVLKQAGSLPLAAAYLGAENMSFDMFRKRRRNRDFIAKYTQELQWRAMGYSMPETKQLKEKPSKVQKGGEKLVAAALKPLDYIPGLHVTKESREQFAEDAFGGGYITKMDEGVASVLWAWAENKVEKEYPDLEVGDQKTIDEGRSPFYKKVAEEFNRAVSHSQSVSDVAHQSTIRRSDGLLSRTFTMFRSDSAQTYNALRQMLGEKAWFDSQAERYGKAEGERAKELAEQAQEESRKAAKRVGTVVISLACNAFLAECVNLLGAAIKGKLKRYEDDEEERLTVLSTLSEMGMGMLESGCGLVTSGDELAAIVGAWITGESRYDMEAPGLEQIKDLIDRIEQAGKMTKEGDILGAAREIGLTFSTYFAGFPAENMEKYLITGIAKHLFPGLVAGYEDALEAPEKNDLKGMTGAALEVRLGNVLKGYGMEPEEELRRLLAQLYEAGYTDVVPSEAPNSIKIDGAELELSKQQRRAYDQKRSDILNQELTILLESEQFTELDEKAKTRVLDRLYDYAAQLGRQAALSRYKTESFVQEWQEIAEAGGTAADCALFKILTGKNGDIPEMQNYIKADFLQDWDAEETVKELMFRYLVTDSQDDEIQKLKEEGLSFAQFLDIYTVHGEIDSRDIDATQKATEFAYWLDGQRYTDTQKAAIKNEKIFFQFTPARAAKYERATGAGLSREEAAELTRELDALVPPEGKTQPTNVQKYRVAIDRSVNEANQLKQLQSVGLKDEAYEKVAKAYELGLAPAAWVRGKELEETADTDGSGGVSQAEWEAVIESMCTYSIVLPGDNTRFNLTNEQKAVLWQMLTGSRSSKNNPYSKAAGQKWLDAMGYGKEE